jgi:hypothetical protein
MTEIKITLKNAKDMEEFVKINATKTTIDSKGNVRCDIENILETYFLIYDDEKLTSIIKKCAFNSEDVFIVKYVVEQTKEIVIYGTKIKYTSADREIVNLFIKACNGYIKNECGIDKPTSIQHEMFNRGLCDKLMDGSIINMKYGYDLV